MAEFSFDHPIFSRRLPLRPPVVLPHDLVREILTWLPVKSLMRFKCVSRIWLSIITDPSFAVVYRGGFRGVVLHSSRFRLLEKKRFFYASLDFKGGRSSYQFCGELVVDHRGKAMGCTEIVNGLLCFYNREYSYLFNPATREKLELPSSSAVVDASKYKACSYHLGYDCVNKLYKLLKICPVYSDYPHDEDDSDMDYWYLDFDFVQNLTCEIITIGVDSSWRILDSYPTIEITLQSQCINGVLYWLETPPELREEWRNCLVAFDLVEEKFNLIPTPAPDDEFANFNFLFAPSLALTKIGWASTDTIYHYCDGIWKQQKVRLPPPSSAYLGCTPPFEPLGILPSGELIITDLGFFVRPIYLYHPSKDEVEELHPVSSQKYELSVFEGTYHEETIIPLKSLTRKNCAL